VGSGCCALLGSARGGGVVLVSIQGEWMQKKRNRLLCNQLLRNTVTDKTQSFRSLRKSRFACCLHPATLDANRLLSPEVENNFRDSKSSSLKRGECCIPARQTDF
jgi:hypothetical protein